MKVASVPTAALVAWVGSLGDVAPPREVEFHVLAQGYELRAGDYWLRLDIDPDRRRFVAPDRVE